MPTRAMLLLPGSGANPSSALLGKHWHLYLRVGWFAGKL